MTNGGVIASKGLCRFLPFLKTPLSYSLKLHKVSVMV